MTHQELIKKHETRRKIPLDLTKVNGNAFALMGAFAKAAKKDGWAKEEIEEVLNVCMSGAYDQLIWVLANLTE